MVERCGVVYFSVVLMQCIAIYKQILFSCYSWIKNEYDNPEVIITENGWSDDGQLNDVGRIDYLKVHLQAILEARTVDECNVTGYTHWSVVDNFEWTRGYS